MQYRTLRACLICGKPFQGNTGCYYCSECAKMKKADTVVRIRTCKDCGAEFPGGPRAKRCPDCAHKAQLETDRRHRQTGTRRPLGSIDKCIICGQEYTVTSGRQKYCSEACQRKGVLAWQKEHKKGYSKQSGQDIKKMERRKHAEKICVYCQRTFSSSTSTNLCSDYCRAEHRKMQQAIADAGKGNNRNLKKYEEQREKYREEHRND